MQNYLTSELLGYKIFTSDLKTVKIDSKVLINTINQYSFIIADKDPAFKQALLKSDVLLPDGIGIIAAAKLLNGETIKKVAGADIHQYLLEELQAKQGSCMYLGSSDATLNKIKERLASEYPAIKFYSYSPPYKSCFSEEDNKNMVNAVNSYKPNVLFVGMTAPKQEKWANTYKDVLDTNIICSIGAVFDFYAGTVSRPNQVWINFGLEWLGRLIKEPKRMWKRYLYYGPVFVYNLTKEKIKQVF